MAAASQHEDLITGLRQYYRVLIKMDYLTEADVRLEPYNGSLDMSSLAALNFTLEVLELLPALPCMRASFINDHEDECRVPLTPDSDVVAYAELPVNTLLDEAREVWVDGPKLPHDEFKIASGWRNIGANYAYSVTKRESFVLRSSF